MYHLLKEDLRLTHKELLMVNVTIMAGLLVLFALAPVDVTQRQGLDGKLSILVTGSLTFFAFAIPVICILWVDFSGGIMEDKAMKMLRFSTFVGFLLLMVLMFTIYLQGRIDMDVLSKNVAK